MKSNMFKRARKIFCVAWLSVVLLPGSAHAQTRGLTLTTDESYVGDYWLLAIGIDDYRFWPKLHSAVHDTRAVAEMLREQYGFSETRSITLINEAATKDKVFDAFVQLKGKLQENDLLLIYFAGHGVLDDFDTGSWVPVDARQNAISDYVSTDAINRMLAKLPARHVFLVADACYSGSLFAERGANLKTSVLNDRYFRENIRRSSRQALTSGGIESVLDGGGRDGHSIFAFHFLSELKNNQNDYISASALSVRVQQLVARNSPQEPKWNHLKFAGDEDGEFFFLRALRDAPAPSALPATINIATSGTVPASVMVSAPPKQNNSDKATPPIANIDFSEIVTQLLSAYQQGHLAKLKAIADLPAPKETLFKNIFALYPSMQVQVADLSAAANSDMTITLKIDNAITHEGDEVEPSPAWNTNKVNIPRAGDGWGRVQWQE